MNRTRTISGKVYKLVVFKVLEKDGEGPRVFRLLRDDETTSIGGGEEFWTGYVPEENTRRYS